MSAGRVIPSTCRPPRIVSAISGDSSVSRSRRETFQCKPHLVLCHVRRGQLRWIGGFLAGNSRGNSHIRRTNIFHQSKISKIEPLYRRPKKPRIAITMTTAPTIYTILFMKSFSYNDVEGYSTVRPL